MNTLKFRPLDKVVILNDPSNDGFNEGCKGTVYQYDAGTKSYLISMEHDTRWFEEGQIELSASDKST